MSKIPYLSGQKISGQLQLDNLLYNGNPSRVLTLDQNNNINWSDYISSSGTGSTAPADYYTKGQSDSLFYPLSNPNGYLNSVSWSIIGGRPTKLSQFTNDLGNYGNWITKTQGDTFYQPLENQRLSKNNDVIFNSISSTGYTSGAMGSGFKMYSNGLLEVDSLTVRKTLNVNTLNIREITGNGGSLAITNTFLVDRVEDAGTVYILYMNTEGGTIFNQIKIGDIVRCQVWDGSGIKYYTGRIGTADASSIRMAKSAMTGTGIPAKGDKLFQFGSYTDVNRQGMIYLTNSDTGAPYLDILDGINTESTASKTKVRLGKLNGITDASFGTLSGYGLYADNAYIKGVINVVGGNAQTITGSQAQADAARNAAILSATTLSNTVKAIADNALANANTANTKLAEFSNDNLLLPSEKQSIAKDWEIIKGEKTIIESQALTYSISSTAYTTAYNSLSTYITPLLSNLTVNSTIVGTTFRANFKAYHDAKASLVKLVSDAAKTFTTNSINTANATNKSYTDSQLAITSGATLLAANNSAQVKADAAETAAKNASKTYADTVSNSAASAAQIAAAADALNKANQAKNDAIAAAETARLALVNQLKSMAYVDIVEVSKLGSTIIQGGYIKTNLLDVTWLKANIINANEIIVSGGGATTAQLNQAKIDVTNAAATDATNKVNNIVVGGRNYLRNSNFETNLFTWQNYGGVQTGIVSSKLRVTFAATNTTYGANFVSVQTNPLILVGETYTISATITTTKAMNIVMYIGGSSVVKSVNGTARLTFTAPVSSVNKLFMIYATTMVAGDYYEIDNVKIEQGNKATDWTPAPEDISDEVKNIQIGGNNLLVNSGILVDTSSYLMVNYLLADGNNTIKAGEEVTATIWGTLGTGKTGFGLYNSGGSLSLATLSPADMVEPGVYRKTFNWSVGATNNTHISVYALTNAVTSVSRINKIQIERGNKGTDWTPAIKDTEKAITDAQAASIASAKVYSDAQDNLKLIETKAYADGKVSAEEARAIADATAKLNEAKADSAAKDLVVKNAALADATAKANAVKVIADAAQASANTGIANAATANQLLADIANDNLLTPSEKQDTLKEWQQIQGEKTYIEGQAATYGVASATYTSYYNALNTYITPLLSSLTNNSTILGTTFRANFKNYYDAKVALLKLVTDAAKAAATTAENNAIAEANKLKKITVTTAGKIFHNPFSISGNVNQSGALVIDTGILFNGSFMNRIKIKGFNYVEGNGDIDLTITFYSYVASLSFIQTSFVSSGSKKITQVRLARNATKNSVVIIIGTDAEVWQYPKLVVEEVLVTYQAAPDTIYDNWTGSFTTTPLTGLSGLVGVTAFISESEAGSAAKAAAALASANATSKTYSDSQIAIANAATLQSANNTAQQKADAANTAAQAAAKTYSDTVSSTKSTAAETAAKAYALQQADLKKAEAIASAEASRVAFANTLKSLAYQDVVEVAKLGTSVISGGFIRTTLLDAVTIKSTIINSDYIYGLNITARTLAATTGTIANWNITSDKFFSGTNPGNYIELQSGTSPQLYMKNAAQTSTEYSSINSNGMYISSQGNQLNSAIWGSYQAVAAYKLKPSSDFNAIALFASAPVGQGIGLFVDGTTYMSSHLSCNGTTTLNELNVLNTMKVDNQVGATFIQNIGGGYGLKFVKGICVGAVNI